MSKQNINVRFHFLHDLTKDGTVELVYCNTQNQVADIMTKPLKLEMFEKLRELLDVFVARYKLIASANSLRDEMLEQLDC